MLQGFTLVLSGNNNMYRGKNTWLGCSPVAVTGKPTRAERKTTPRPPPPPPRRRRWGRRCH